MWWLRRRKFVMSIEIHEGRDNPKQFDVSGNIVNVEFPTAELERWCGVPYENIVEAMPNDMWNSLIDFVSRYLKIENERGKLKKTYMLDIDSFKADLEDK